MQKDKTRIHKGRSELSRQNSSKGDPPPFSLVQAEGEPPCERFGHSAVLMPNGGGLIIIFGGTDEKGRFCSDTHVYNIELNQWHALPVKDPVPPGRHFHSAVLFNDQMYIFGGTSNGYYSDLWRFNLDTQTWYLVPTNSPPSPRLGHSAVVFGDCMYVYGGFDKDGFACNDIYEFSFETNKWNQIKLAGPLHPRDSYHHSAVVYQGSMYIFGGYKCTEAELYEYRFGARTWSVVKTTGQPPSPRWGHRAVLFKGVMYIFGGRDAVSHFSDVFEFHFETLSWKRASADGITPRFFAAAVADDEYLFVFGGKNIHNFPYNELYKYNLAKKPKRRPDTLIDDLRRLVNNPALSDVRFRFPHEGDKILYAHRNILALRCAPFQAMLRVPMKEAREGEIVIEDKKYRTFYILLEYLYTGQLYAPAEEVVDVLMVADLYDLDHLKALCERKLIRYVDPSSVLSMLSLAEQYKAPELKSYCLRLVGKNYSELRDSDSFRRLSASLLTDISRLERDKSPPTLRRPDASHLDRDRSPPTNQRDDAK